MSIARYLLLLAALPCWAQSPRLVSQSDVEAHCQRPVLSPDARWVAYEMSLSGQRKELFAIRLDGGRPIRIVPSGGGSRFGGPVDFVCQEACWDPSGRPRLLFSCAERGLGNYDLYLAEVFEDHATVARVTTDPANEGGPAWGLLGGSDFIVFTSAKTGAGDLYRLDLSGGTPERLTRSLTTDDFAVLARSMDRLLFVQRTSRAGGEGVYQLSVPPSGDAMKLADWPGSDETNPSISPDGRRVAFYSNRGHRNGQDEAFDLYVVEAGGKPRLLYKKVAKSDGMGPAWLPDGSAIVTAVKDGLDPLVMVSMTGAPLRVLKTGTEMNGDVSIGSPGGGKARMVFTAQGLAGERGVKRWRRLYVLDLP